MNKDGVIVLNSPKVVDLKDSTCFQIGRDCIRRAGSVEEAILSYHGEKIEIILTAILKDCQDAKSIHEIEQRVRSIARVIDYPELFDSMAA